MATLNLRISHTTQWSNLQDSCLLPSYALIYIVMAPMKSIIIITSKCQSPRINITISNKSYIGETTGTLLAKVILWFNHQRHCHWFQDCVRNIYRTNGTTHTFEHNYIPVCCYHNDFVCCFTNKRTKYIDKCVALLLISIY